MMTGWTGEPEAERPAMPTTSFLLDMHDRRAGVLETSLARAAAAEAREDREAAASAPDPDERAAQLVTRGLRPGMISDLGQRLADAEGELAAEREKIAKGERVAARVRGMLERGQLGGLEASRMMDGDFGDEHRAEQLERRADRLRQQLAAAQTMIAPQREQPADPLEAATRTAHDVFREVTRQRMAEAQAGTARREPRPFGYASRAGAAVRSEMCVHCTADGVSDELSYLLHSDPELNVPVTPPEMTDAELAEFGRQVGIPYRSRPHKAGERVPVPESYGVVIRDGGPILGVS
jgi:hypothetical protein